jgi:DNA-binding response OmpR family regulator
MIKVLAVDDSPTMHRLFKMIFSDDEYELKLADNGEDGLAFAKQMLPDIILLDFIMPKMNGFHFCKALRDIDSLKDVPILLITSKADDVGDKFTNKFSNIECIAKPFQPDELLDKMNSFFKDLTPEIDNEEQLEDPIALEESYTTNEKILHKNELETDYAMQDAIDYNEENNQEQINEQKLPAQDKEFIESDHNKVINQIISKVEKDVLPTLRTVIERFLKFQTGFMISDISGETININKFQELAEQYTGELIIFNNEKDYHFMFENGALYAGCQGNDFITDAFELFQDVSGLCLLEVESLSELYEQVKKLELSEGMIQKCYKFYLLSVISEALNTLGTSYYLNEIDIPENLKSEMLIQSNKIEQFYNDYIEERTEINKILYDEFITPVKREVKTLENLTDFEKNLIGLCNGRRNLNKILSYFGRNKQFVKNTIGMLILTGYLEIGGV